MKENGHNNAEEGVDLVSEYERSAGKGFSEGKEAREPPRARRGSEGLHFSRSSAHHGTSGEASTSASGKSKGSFRWSEVDRQLALVPKAYREEKFDSLAQLVGILNAHDPVKALKQVQEHRARVEALLDGIVRSHHSGFTRAIHNYSEILRLFSEAQSRVAALKKDLWEGRARVGTHSTSLHHYWREAEMLRDALKELGNIEKHASAPQRLDELLRSGRPLDCIEPLVAACTHLGKKEAMAIPALISVRHDLSAAKARLDSCLRASLREWLGKWSKGEGSTARALSKAGSAGAPDLEALSDSDTEDLLETGDWELVGLPGSRAARTLHLRRTLSSVGRIGPLRRALQWVRDDLEAVLETSLVQALEGLYPREARGMGAPAIGVSSAALSAAQQIVPEMLAVVADVTRRLVRLLCDAMAVSSKVTPSPAVAAVSEEGEVLGLEPGAAAEGAISPREVVAEVLRGWSIVQSFLADVATGMTQRDTDSVLHGASLQRASAAPAGFEVSAWRRWWSGEKRGQDDAGPNSADASGRHAGATRRKPRFSLSASLWDGKTLDAVPAPGVSVTRGNAVAPSWQGAHNVGAQPRRGGASRVLAHASARFPALDGHRGPAMIPLIHGSFRTFLSAQWEVIRAAARQLGCALPAPGPAGDCPGFEGIPVSTLDDHLSTAAQEIFLPWCEAEAQSLCDRAVQRASGMSGIGIALGSALHGAGGGGEAARREDAGRVGAASESAFSGNDGSRKHQASDQSTPLLALERVIRSVEFWQCALPSLSAPLSSVALTCASAIAAAVRQALEAAQGGGTRGTRLARNLASILEAEARARWEAGGVGGAAAAISATASVAEALLRDSPPDAAQVLGTASDVGSVVAVGVAAEVAVSVLASAGTSPFIGAARHALGCLESRGEGEGRGRGGAEAGLGSAVRPVVDALKSLSTEAFRAARMEVAARTLLHVQPVATRAHGSVSVGAAADESIVRLSAFLNALSSRLLSIPRLSPGTSAYIFGLVGPVGALAVAQGLADSDEVTTRGIQRLAADLLALGKAVEEIPVWKGMESSLDLSMRPVRAARKLCEALLRPIDPSSPAIDAVHECLGPAGAAVALSAKIPGRAASEQDWQALGRVVGVSWVRIQNHLAGTSPGLSWAPAPPVTVAEAVGNAAGHAVSAILGVGSGLLGRGGDQGGSRRRDSGGREAGDDTRSVQGRRSREEGEKRA